MYCLYYQAHILPAKTWFFVGVMRGAEHLCFDRTLDKNENIFEFFVPEGNEGAFLEIAHYMERAGILSRLEKMPNRLAQPGAIF